ncbi:MAG TPA: hypothetical protein VL475_08415 [Planctomycetaceae bacterium]|nr:hypothetical protein [Planctomycetaceae bacterium]
MASPGNLTPPEVKGLSEQLSGRAMTDSDAAAVAGLLNALNADMRALRELPIPDTDEPATIYAAVEGER